MPSKSPARARARVANIDQARTKLRINGRTARDLGIAILNGQYPPGGNLPNEVDASTRLGISRTAYREAIRTLAAKGLVSSRPKTGTAVNPRSSWNLLDPDILEWAFEEQPSEDFVLALFELRGIVEPAAAALAAERRTTAQLAVMGHALEEMAKHGFDARPGQIADRRFHEQILAATGNEMVIALTRTISTAVEATTLFKHRRAVIQERDPLPEHQELYAAIAERDPERARTATTIVIRLALEDIKRGMAG